MDLDEVLEDYRKSKNPMSQEDFERLTNKQQEMRESFLKLRQKIAENPTDIEGLIDTIDEFRRKYHNKFKDANTFWEMLYDKIRETL
jgi:dephospho-CoA kinase